MFGMGKGWMKNLLALRKSASNVFNWENCFHANLIVS
jgi:hypothetical protein